MLVDIKEELKKLETVANRKLGSAKKYVLTESRNVESTLNEIAKEAGFNQVFEDVVTTSNRVANIKAIQELRSFLESL